MQPQPHPSAPPPLTPADLVGRLDDIVGQRTAKEKLAGALWYNAHRLALIRAGQDGERLPAKQNVLLAGPTGTGKTFLARRAAALCGVPFFATSAASYSAAGYVGLNPEDMIGGLLAAAGGDVARAEAGIVFLDEVDKIRTRDFGGQDDVGGKAVQQALLPFLEGTTALLKKGDDRLPVRTGGITFIAAGAFAGLDETIRRHLRGGYDIDEEALDEEDVRHLCGEDLIRFGLIPEFVARFPVRVGLVPLDREGLTRLLRQSGSSPLRQTAHLFGLHGIELRVEDAAVEAVVELALEEGTGARGLQEVVLDRLVPLINSLPELLADGVARVIVDADVIRRRCAPWKIAGEPIGTPLDLARLSGPEPEGPVRGTSDTTGWPAERVRARLEEVRQQLDYDNTTGSARKWWEAFERDNERRPALVLRLAEELAARRASLTEFFLSYVYSNTDNIQANLHYLDYTRLKKEEERRKKEAAARARPARFRTGETCPAAAGGDYQFDGYLDGVAANGEGAGRRISVRPDEVFPPGEPSGKPCWWKRAGA
jgi:ATP-dependent Clp protease ATP-binding subunit ClpX